MSQDDLGPAPEPQIEPGEPNPGGVDAVSHPDGAEALLEGSEEAPAPVMRDPDPDANPAVENAVPDEMKQGEDTSTKATESPGGVDDGIDPEEESPV